VPGLSQQGEGRGGGSDQAPGREVEELMTRRLRLFALLLTNYTAPIVLWSLGVEATWVRVWMLLGFGMWVGVQLAWVRQDMADEERRMAWGRWNGPTEMLDRR